MLKYKEILGDGFQVVLDYDGWRIASLTYDQESNDIFRLKNLGRHHDTVEAFILLEGEADMLVAGYGDIPCSYLITSMEKSKIYYVEKHQWHAALLYRPSKLLIFENRNTDETNSEKYLLSNEERELIIRCYKNRDSSKDWTIKLCPLKP